MSSISMGVLYFTTLEEDGCPLFQRKMGVLYFLFPLRSISSLHSIRSPQHIDAWRAVGIYLAESPGIVATGAADDRVKMIRTEDSLARLDATRSRVQACAIAGKDKRVSLKSCPLRSQPNPSDGSQP